LDFTEHEKSHPIPVKGGLVEELTKGRKRQSIENLSKWHTTMMDIVKNLGLLAQKCALICCIAHIIENASI